MNKKRYDSDDALKNGDPATAMALYEGAIIDEGQMKDTQYEQDVANQANAEWTSVHYWCTRCDDLDGEIDVITKSGVFKECKRNGHADHDQMTNHLIVAQAMLGAGAAVHLAIPSSKIRAAKDSLRARGLDKHVDTQPHDPS